ncbi:MAG: VWA-like domain-containing protein [Nitrososphaeria archaeon]
MGEKMSGDLELTKERVFRARAALWRLFPFVASILARIRIVAVRGLQFPAGVNATTLVIDVDQTSQMSDAELVGLLAHETLHLAFRDVVRRGDRVPMAWNVAADAINNEILSSYVKLPEGAVRMRLLADALGERIPEGISKEQLYDKLLKKAKAKAASRPQWGDLGAPSESQMQQGGGQQAQPPQQAQQGSQPQPGAGSGKKGKKQGQGPQPPAGAGGQRRQKGGGGAASSAPTPQVVGVIQEGDPSLRDEDEERREEAWRRALARARAAQAGTAPGALEREISQLLKSRVPWRNLLRQALRDGYGRGIVQSWKRLNRRVPELPGARRLTTPRAWVLVDASGSIDDKTFDQFMAEVVAAARAAGDVILVAWDAEVKGVWKYHRGMKMKITGGGGTVIRPALELVKEKMQPNDVVAVLSDFELSDYDSGETAALARAVKARAAVAIAATVDRNPPASWGWRTVRVQ